MPKRISNKSTDGCKVSLDHYPLRTLSHLYFVCRQPQHLLDHIAINIATGKIVKGFVRRCNHVLCNERRALGSALFGMLERAFPFENRPAIIAIMAKLCENLREIDLPVAKRPEATGAFFPARIAAINTRFTIGPKLGVLDVKSFDPLMIEIDELDVIELLQHEMRWIIKDVGAWMIVDCFEESLKRYTVVEVFARVQFIADVDAVLIKGVKDWLPAAAEFGKALLNQPSGALRPRIH